MKYKLYMTDLVEYFVDMIKTYLTDANICVMR